MRSMHRAHPECVRDRQGEHGCVCVRLEIDATVECDCVIRDLEGITLRKHLMTLVDLPEHDGGHFVSFVEVRGQIARFAVDPITLR